MAEITYGSILSSKPYSFLVGPREREFFIHASLVAKKSSVLDSIVNNGVTKQEANGTVVWRHVDEDTFIRFAQYLYTGNYEGSAPSQLAAATASPSPVVEEKKVLEPQPPPDKVAYKKPVDPPVREPATHAELEAVAEPVLDEAIVSKKDVRGLFTLRGKVASDDDWGLSTARALKPADEEPAAPQPVLEPCFEECGLSKKGKKKKKKEKEKKKKQLLVASEPESAEAVVELVVEEEPAPAELAEEDVWNFRPAEPEPEFEPAPAKEAPWDVPVPEPEPAPAKEAPWGVPVPESEPAPAEEAPWGVPVPEPEPAPAEEAPWDVPAPEPEPDRVPVEKSMKMSLCGLSKKEKKEKKKKKKSKEDFIASKLEPAQAVIDLIPEKGREPAEPDVSFQAAPLQKRPVPMLKEVWHSFNTELRYDCGTRAGHFDAPSNEADSALEYTGVFLSHARVHALADDFQVEPLAQLALHKLHRILCAFTLHEARIGDVVALLRYSYEKCQWPREQLRVLVSKFAACHLKTLWMSEAFRALLAACGELAEAIIGHVISKLV